MTTTLPMHFGDPGAPNGYRLEVCELLNWGTFDGSVWTLAPDGSNTLITGDIGSGKSTLVDALTTLFVPAHRIIYNAAAGAERRERDLRSYVLGYYKRERDDLTARPVSLRDDKCFSVVLARFTNVALGRAVTLAHCFYFRPGVNQPERIFVIATRPLSIAEHFDNFGGDIKRLKQKLRKLDNTRLCDAYPEYSRALCKALSIRRPDALNMLYQTVSMKSVGNLTHFVRQHMLEAPDTAPRIDGIIRNFHNLSQAHQSVVEARRQIEELTPIVTSGQAEAGERQRIECGELDRNNIDAFVAKRKCALLEDTILQRDRERLRVDEQQRQLASQIQTSRADLDSVKQAIWEAGGSRLAQIGRELTTLATERDRRRRKFDELDRLCQELDVATPSSLTGFQHTRETITQNAANAESVRDKLRNLLTENSVRLHQLTEEHTELDAEIKALSNRRSNIPSSLLSLRSLLAQHIGVEEDTMPFAGELIRVHEREREWEGAIERLLHNFALSLLVTPDLYDAVSDYVERADLKGRIVYFKIVEQKKVSRPRDLSIVRNKVEIRPDTAFSNFLEHAFAQRFDHTCAADLKLFRRARKALTRSGQIRGLGERHEKDDTHRVDDRRRFVLGWSNERKLRALAQNRERVADKSATVAEEIARTQQRTDQLDERLTNSTRLTAIADFDEVNFQSIAARIDALKHEQDTLRSSSDTLKTLEQRRAQCQKELETREDKHTRQIEKLTELSTRLEQSREELKEATELASGLDNECVPRLETRFADVAADDAFSLRSAGRIGQTVRASIQADIDAARKRRENLQARLVRDMQKFKTNWPERTKEMDAAVEACSEYAAMLEQLNTEDLPRFEQRFESLLREQAIHDIVLFANDLDNTERDIRRALERINRSLGGVTYDRRANTYIHLLAQRSAEPEIREFRKELREVAAGAIGEQGDDPYSETKFHQVRSLVERLKGRENHSELDRRWRAKVTDVRNWFEFSVSERYREDDSEREHFTDSGGKSGGQKEKLAYTILATALAYQFDLEWNAEPSDNFRFAMIDEAFGRGSDESARYGLDLFRQLNMQLLIITPLQKIHVIEDYVSTVGFVHSVDNTSELLQLTIEEYRAGKDAHRLTQGHAPEDLGAREER